MNKQNIRNFSIIAHIDHGKSTLADRLLEATHTIEKRKMKEQILDQMELERERGITIKMQPVRMKYTHNGSEYLLNLIDTPGHIDFSYEVSRALAAVEGVILLVDATQGIQAQTLSTLDMARKEKLPVLPIINKIDLPNAQILEVEKELTLLLSCKKEDILHVSGKTGEGVDILLNKILMNIPLPKEKNTNKLQSLIFDFEYSNHKGVIIYIRILSGKIKKNDPLRFIGGNTNFVASEVGVFSPEKIKKDELSSGEIGYIVTGVKDANISFVGDTITHTKSDVEAIPGFQNPKPVVWASIYPESQDDFDDLRKALERLSLEDSSVSFEEEESGVIGRGFRCGFLGMLHLEIIFERLKREFSLTLIVTNPTITYEIIYKNGKKEVIYSPAKFPDEGTYELCNEPWVVAHIITPGKYLGGITQLIYEHGGSINGTENMSEYRMQVNVLIPLRELMHNFFDELKSVSSGFASLSYDIEGMRKADVHRIDVLVAGEPVFAFSRVISFKRVQSEAEQIVNKLKEILPRQMFVVKIQVRARGRIIASRTLSALKKNVTAKLYGGDITRKMKLREKQKKGKKKMQALGRVTIPQEVFLKMMKR